MLPLGVVCSVLFSMLPVVDAFLAPEVLLVAGVVVALVLLFYPYIVWRKEAAALEGVQSP